MDRINVSEGFRVMKTNCHFKMEFSAKVDMRKAYEAMEAAVKAISETDGYYPLWLQDLGDCCDNDCFDISSTLHSDEFYRYVPAMYKAVAEAFPSSEFEAYAWYDDLKCYWVDEFEATFKGNRLSINETFADDNCGYFCPECGYQVALHDEVIEGDEIACDDCDETIKVSDLVYVPATVTKSEYTIQ